VVIASDGKRGHENQSRVLARMLGVEQPVVLCLRPCAEELPLRLRLALIGRRGLSQLRAADIVRRNLQPESPEAFRELARAFRAAQGLLRFFTVSTGTAPAAFNLVLARMLGAAAIVNMTPSLLPRRLFDLNIVPEHDWHGKGAKPDNVLTTPLALGYHDVRQAQLLAQRLASEHCLDLQAGYLALSIGGPTRDFPYGNVLRTVWPQALAAAARQLGWRLLITTSRRTPREDTAAWTELARRDDAVAYFLDAQRDPLNPLPAFYELARVVCITADSYSMISEAIHAGHHPLVILPGSPPREGKLLRSLRRLAQCRRITLCDPVGAGAEQLATLLATLPPRGAANADYEALRAQVRAFLGAG
jgi:mitochondrial fission protein ELM1